MGFPRLLQLIAHGVACTLLLLLLLLANVRRQVVAQSSDAQSFLNPHNAARAAVGVPALTWDTNLETYARNWATHQRDTANCALVHSNGRYGENIFWGKGRVFTAADAVAAWVNERANYHYDTNSCDAGRVCGHYTQVVWRSTTQLGCASIQCNDGATFIICSYNPPGNYAGQRPYSLLIQDSRGN